MRGLLLGIVILLVVGIAGFFYRNALEHPIAVAPGATACTMEAKICPDGTSVGRSGPNCAFAACPAPNVEVTSIHTAFALPAGYAENQAALGQDATLAAAYEKTAASTTNAIVVRAYPIPAGKTATSTIIANTMFEPSGMTATSLGQFTKKLEGQNTFYCATLERFEGQVHTACYLPRATDVLRFEVLEKGVDWTNPSLNIDALPEHAAFYRMLATVQA